MSFYLTEFTREETSWQVAYLTCYLGCWASSPTFWNNIDFLPPGLPFLPQCPSFNSQVKCSQYESGTEGCKWKTQVLNEFAMGLFLKEGRKSSCLFAPLKPRECLEQSSIKAFGIMRGLVLWGFYFGSQSTTPLRWVENTWDLRDVAGGILYAIFLYVL